ncbi:MAG: hypothetical protein RLY97_1193, partial [Pseudomonadota bacterium]
MGIAINLAVILSAAAPAAAAAAAPAPPTDEANITVHARLRPSKADPLVRINEKSYEVVQGLDTAVVAPLANGYKAALPSPLRTGLRNGLRNMGEPVVA